MECVGTKRKQTLKRLIYSITIVAPTPNTNSQSPLSNLFLKVTSKLNTYMKDTTFRQGGKVETKLNPTFKVIVKYLSRSTMDIFEPTSKDIYKSIIANNVTFKTSTKHFLPHVDDANNINKCNSFLTWARY